MCVIQNSARLTTFLQRRHASDVWTVMFLFGGIPEHELNGPGIHDLRNILTLEIGIHMSFKAWEIWLEAVEVCPGGAYVMLLRLI